MFSLILMTVKGAILIFAAVYAFTLLLREEDARWVKGAPLYIFVGMFVIGMWVPSVWLLFFALMIAIPFFAKTRADAAALYAVAVISVPTLYYHVLIGSFYLMPFSKYTFCMFGLLIAFFIRRVDTDLDYWRFDLPMILMLILEFAAGRGELTDTIRSSAAILLMIAMPYFLVSRSISNPEEARRFALAIALGGFVMAVVGTLESRLHWLIYQQLEGHLHLGSSISAYAKTRGGVLRAPGTFPESTSLGTYVALAGVAVLGLRSSFPSRNKWLIALGVLLFGLIAPNSRGAFISIFIGVLVFDLYRWRLGAFITKVAIGGVLYLCALIAAQSFPFVAEMIGQGQGGAAGTSEYRMQLLARGMEEIRKNPVLGTTLKNALSNLDDMRQGEGIIDLVNAYISYGLTLGYTGMVALFLVFASLCVAMVLAGRQLARNPTVGDLAGFVFATSFFMIFNSFFTAFGGDRSSTFYEVCALGAALWAMRKTALVDAPTGKFARTAPTDIRAIIAADRAGADARAAALPGRAPG